MPNFMLLATAWGPKFGGINAFNMDFAAGLAGYLGKRGKVFCTAFSPSLEDRRDAEEKGVSLLGIDRPTDSAKYDKTWAFEVWQEFEKQFSNESIDWWVGHDVITGWAATEGPAAVGKGQSALIMHMNYADYQAYKVGVGLYASEKIKEQRELFGRTKCHFAVGPLLRDALKNIVRHDVPMLIPGFADVPIRPSLDRLKVITFGRMDRESDRIKQSGLAVAGFGSAVAQARTNKGMPSGLRNNPQMWVIGIDEPGGDEERALSVCPKRS